MMKDEMIDNRDTSSNKMKDDFIRHLCPSMVVLEMDSIGLKTTLGNG